MSKGKKIKTIFKRAMSLLLCLAMVFTSSAMNQVAANAAPGPKPEPQVPVTVKLTVDGNVTNGSVQMEVGQSATLGYEITPSNIVVTKVEYYLEDGWYNETCKITGNVLTALDDAYKGEYAYWPENVVHVKVTYYRNGNKGPKDNYDTWYKGGEVKVFIEESFNITASIDKDSVLTGETAKVTAETTKDATVSFTSSDASVATIDAEGNVTAVAPGTVTFTASANGKSDSVTLTVNARELAATAAPTTMFVGETSVVTVTGNVAASYTVSDESVITYADGIVTATGAGEATLTVSGEGVDSVVIPFTVIAKNLDLTADAESGVVGDTIGTTVTKNFDGEVTYSTSDANVATVAADGTITLVGVGTATITASSNGVSDSVVVTAEAKKYPFTVNYFLATTSSYVLKETVTVYATDIDAVLADQTVIGVNGSRSFDGKKAVLVDSTKEGSTVNLYYADLTDFISVTKSLVSTTPDADGKYTINFGVNAANLPTRDGKGGNNVVLLIDVSRSMAMDMDNTNESDDHMAKTWENTRWYAMRTAVNSFLDAMLPAGNTLNKVTLITYASDAKLEVANATDKTSVMNKLDAWFNEDGYKRAAAKYGDFGKKNTDVDVVGDAGYFALQSGTNHAAALELANKTMKSWDAKTKENTVVVLLTDGYGNRANGKSVNNDEAAKVALEKGNALKRENKGVVINSIAMLNVELGDAIYKGLGMNGNVGAKKYDGYADAFYHANDYSAVLNSFNAIAKYVVNFPETSNMYFLDGIAADFTNASAGLATVEVGGETLYKIPVASMNANGTIQVKVASSAMGAAFTNTRAFFNFTVYGTEFSKMITDMPIAYIPAHPANDSFSVVYGDVLTGNVAANDGYSNLKTDAAATVSVKAETITLADNKGTVVLNADGSFTYTQGAGVANGDTVSFDYTTVLSALGVNGETTATATITVTVKKVNVTVNYVGIEAEDVPAGFVSTISEELPVGASYSYTTAEVADYAADQDVVSGTVPNEDVTVTVTYTKIRHGITINYVYEDGTTAAPSYRNSAIRGSRYNVTSPVIDDYSADKLVVSGNITDEDTVVTVTYYEKSVVAIALENQTLTYNGTAQEIEAATTTALYTGYTKSVEYSLDGFRFTTTVPSFTEAGTYTVTAHVIVTAPETAPAAESFAGYKNLYAETTATITVNKAAVVVAADNAHKTYGDEDPELTATVTGAPATGDAVNYTVVRAEGEDADRYAITVVPGENPNYDVTVEAGTFTVNPKVVVLPNYSDEKVYDGEGYTAEDTVAGAFDEVINVTIETDETDAGNHALVITTDADEDSNYVIVKTASTLTVVAKDVTVTAADADKTYGDENPELTATVTGLVEGDELDYSVTREEGEDADTYVITVVPGENPNYNVITVDGTFTVNPKEIVLPDYSDEKVYDGEDYVAEDTVDGAFDEVIKVTITTESKDAGEQELVITTDADEDGNYIIVKTPGTLTVEKKAATVVANNATKTYGSEDPEFTATVTGVIEGEVLDYTLVREEGKNVGEYAISVVLGDNKNYDITTEGAVLTVNKRNVVVFPINASKKAGEADPMFFANVYYAVPGDDLGIAVWRIVGRDQEAAGTYTLYSNAKENPNYTYTFHTGIFTIEEDENEEIILPVPPVIPVQPVNRPVPPVVEEEPEEVPEIIEVPEIVTEELEDEETAKAPAPVATEELDDEDVPLAALADDGVCYIHWYILGASLLYAVYFVLRALKREKDIKNLKEEK